MQASFDERYRVIESRDPRFDGQFVTAVRSTGVYCRPSCPARTPKPANVTFYPTSAAAHAAGYRACKRCLPEATPGSPEWNIRGDVAARAMRLIADGVVEREGVPGLAARLGYSTRQLDRILHAELGAAPLALARAHRAQTARTLLTGTDLPVADVAFAAGFSSLRQCNDTMQQVFGMTPTALRATRRGTTAAGVDLALPHREPLDAAGVFAWLAARALPGIEHAGAGRYSRTLLLPGGVATFEVRLAGDALRLRAEPATLADLPSLIARVRRLFDLDADPVATDAALAHEPALAASVAATPGIRLPGAVDPAEMLVRAIVGQRVSVAGARTTLRRLAALAVPDTEQTHDRMPDGTFSGDGFSGDGAASSRPRSRFPTPAELAALTPEQVGGPRPHTLLAVARDLADGSLQLHVGESTGHLRERLEQYPGIGSWTSGYLAMRVLGDPDILLTGDLALRSGARTLGLPDRPRELTGRLASVAPWRSYASLHLWRAAASPARPAPLARGGASADHAFHNGPRHRTPAQPANREGPA